MSTSDTPLAVLVGAGPGLGKALARRFAAGGCRLALLSRTEGSRASALAQLADSGHEARGYDCDAGDPASVAAVFVRLREAQGDPAILIYNAGRFLQGGILELDLRQFEAAWHANCYGALLAAREVLPAMLAAGRGTILCTGATAALRGGARFAGLAVGKFGLRALTQSMAREFGPRGIHVAHIVVDGKIGQAAAAPGASGLEPAAIAEQFWQTHSQTRSAWTQEQDLRPFDEKF